MTGGTTSDAAGSEEVQRPTLRVVRGDATAEEVAALVAVLTAAAGGEGSLDDGAGRPAWSDPARTVREPLPHGPSAWRASAWPR